MKAIISTTCNDLYLFLVPFAVYSWQKLGYEVIVLYTDPHTAREQEKLLAAIYYAQARWVKVYSRNHDRDATYSQCARLFAAGLEDLDTYDTLVTSDADMCVFGKNFFTRLSNHPITVVGADLVPEGQYPMCYVAMNVGLWRNVMQIEGGINESLHKLLGEIECDNMRGNYWAKDQETIYNAIQRFGIQPHLIPRSNGRNQFASRRADRDGWEVKPDILDAHLPRPGYEAHHFEKILNLFAVMYPGEDHSWMLRYHAEYVCLM